jgi:hypothetical protein
MQDRQLLVPAALQLAQGESHATQVLAALLSQYPVLHAVQAVAEPLHCAHGDVQATRATL